MPDQGSAADEHAILQEITAPLASLPDDPLPLAADVQFPRVLRGYDPIAVDAYVKQATQLVAELQATRSPEAAVRRALERVGEQISGILQRAHETAEQITTQSRREAEDRLEQARQEAIQIAAAGEQRIKDLDADADRIWAERLRIVEDARELAGQLLALADAAAERFPPAEDTGSHDEVGAHEPEPAAQLEPEPDRGIGGLFDAEAQDDDPDATVVLRPSPRPEREDPTGDQFIDPYADTTARPGTPPPPGPAATPGPAAPPGPAAHQGREPHQAGEPHQAPEPHAAHEPPPRPHEPPQRPHEPPPRPHEPPPG